MTVLSKILFGGLHVESYDLVPSRGDAFEGEEDRTGGVFSLARSAAARAWTILAGGNGRRHESTSIPPREVKAATPSFMLTPFRGNVHSFKAPVTCAVFDVLVRGGGQGTLFCKTEEIEPETTVIMHGEGNNSQPAAIFLRNSFPMAIHCLIFFQSTYPRFFNLDLFSSVPPPTY